MSLRTSLQAAGH